MNAYTPGIERMMKRLFDSLRENDRRRYAADLKRPSLGHGGVEYISCCVLAVRSQDHSRRDRRNWKRRTTWTPDVSEKKGWPQTVDRPSARPSRRTS